ncbi:MAG: imidazole glycerol phosphate synthase subunit HisF [Oscillospiraceae bacterium]|nr:imidazole glycerol phosphate synthase subunit HisF [Oscillospiraceae bacterium]
MLAKRIIPCLDVRNGKVVKGVNFEGIKDVGDPVLSAEEYNRQGADEIVFYDITASFEGRGVFLDVVRETAKKVFVPLTVGGGIKTVDDIRDTLRAGADKVSVNSQAVQNPGLIKEGADIFGSQCICVGIDAKKVSDKKWTVFINGGRVDYKLDLIEWVKNIEQLGAGEICLNSIDADGTKAGFDIEMLDAVCKSVNIPVIASGGAGKIEDFSDVFEKTGATAALAASLFHFKELTVGQVKNYCRNKGIIVR